MKKAKKRIVVIGGGTGTFTVLQGLKHYDVELSVIVSMADSGGSNRVIRDEFGLLPTSDIRQAMIALASPSANGVIRELFNYRFSQGTGITGMTFGNLVMAALTDLYGSQDKGIEATCKLLQTRGDIIPVTFDNVHLIARYDNGKQILGEHFIDEPDVETGKQRIIDLSLVPEAKANKKAIKAIKEADMVVIGPGDLYTSVIADLVVTGIPQALKATKAQKVYVVNLMTKFGQTNGMGAAEHIETLENYMGGAKIDIAIINKSKMMDKARLSWYKKAEAQPVADDLGKSNGLEIVRRDVMSKEKHQKAKGDKLVRSLIRHDSKKLAKVIMKLLK